MRALVVNGTLSLDERLPSSRALASDLRVSRSVSEAAYQQLIAEGWLHTRQGSGTFVAARGLERENEIPRTHVTTGPPLIRLDAGTPFVDPRYRDGWRRAWREVSAATPPRGYDDVRGLPELRVAIAQRLARTRGLDVHADEVLITAGTTDGLRNLLPELRPGPVAIEDPGYRAAVATVRAFGRTVIDLPAAEPVTDVHAAAAVYVTPAHQHPLGPVMPAGDRLALLAAARQADAIVIEDDYDSEFRYDVAPIPALTSLDRDRVAYLGTAAKSVYPTLRLGWLVAPPRLHDAILSRRAFTRTTAAWPSQRAMLTLLRDGWVDKVVRAARRVYAARAPRVAEALSPYGTLAGPLAGMYSTWLMAEPIATSAQESARRAGFDVPLLSGYTRSSSLTGLVVGFGGVSDAELDRALTAIAMSFRSPH